jgi:hypothetical protein
LNRAPYLVESTPGLRIWRHRYIGVKSTYWTRAQSVPGVASLVACITWCWMFHVASKLSKHEIPTKSTLSSCCLQTYQTWQFWCILLLHKPHTLW